uniref:DUF3615 domain-containing protein n=1 Tax=Leersia perrieri TaxID=77586 RepID=A0A0D9WLG3_9ORYZ
MACDGGGEERKRGHYFTPFASTIAITRRTLMPTSNTSNPIDFLLRPATHSRERCFSIKQRRCHAPAGEGARGGRGLWRSGGRRPRLPGSFRSTSQPDQMFVNAAESSSAQAMQEPDVSFSRDLLSDTTSKEPMTAHTSSSPQTVQHDSTPSQCSLWSSPGSSILVRSHPDWYFVLYIRMDRGGYFHIYPDVGGGPFQSLPEVDDAINQHLQRKRIPKMGEELDKLPLVERMIRLAMYWPDGKRKSSKWYYHLNFTAKMKRADGFDCRVDNLFFAEITHMQGEDEWVISCCCVIKPNASGHCYGCRNNGYPGMKHPNNVDAYSGGHMNGCLPFGFHSSVDSDCEDLSLEDEEDMLRRRYKGLDKPGGFKIAYPPFASPILCECC